MLEVGFRLKQLKGRRRGLGGHVTLYLCVFFYAWMISEGGAERWTQDSSVRARHPPAAFLQLYGKKHNHIITRKSNRFFTGK